MFEDNLYEPIAELYLTLNGQSSYEDIYCLCSRVFCEGTEGKGEQQEPVGEEEVSETVSCTVRFCNSSSESQPAQTPKKNHEETVSCYCSASHYSTDEHDSLRDGSILHHSDSGADLSESSRDLDWEHYWTRHGERLIWESWITKYGSYVDPSYLAGKREQVPAEDEETSFCCKAENRTTDSDRKTSFTGLLDSVGQTDTKSVSDCHRNSVDVGKHGEPTPKILVENIRSDIDELLNRRFSDISETAKSVSGKSEDSNLDETDRLRLSVVSRCSGSSALLSATTDSMTNVTRMTLSSSDSSCGVDDSSAKSSSLLSSDSGSSVDQQWQNLWAEHFNEQYFLHFNRFAEKHKKGCSEEVKIDSGLTADDNKTEPQGCSEEVKSDSGLTADDNKTEPQGCSVEVKIDSGLTADDNKSEPQGCSEEVKIDSGLTADDNKTEPQGCSEEVKSDSGLTADDNKTEPQHQESIDEVNSIDSVSEYEQAPLIESEAERHFRRNRLNSVGYLLQQLKAMSVDSTGRIQEEDETLNPVSPPSAMESVKNTETVENTHPDPEREPAEDHGDTDLGNNLVDECGEDDSVSVRHGVKRSHDRDTDKWCTEKVKSAYKLMGLMYDMDKTEKIRKASVWYKKRFSQIRFQNRILRLQKPEDNKHIYFGDDDDVCNTSAAQVEDDAAPDLDTSGELFHDASVSPQLQNSTEPQRLDMEDFSEKDDSTDDEEQEVFFSAEEDNVVNMSQERREGKCRPLPKRRKKRQLKKKYVVNYPEEMIANPKIKKFWRRRYSLFSRFDEGIKMDAESWYSVTPEKIAINIAERCRCDLVVDAFCGAGGNAIQLAFTCERVIAVDIDPLKIELARHNAQIYGVEDRIEFVLGDYLQLAPSLVADVVFLSPPWGGPLYNRQSVFTLDSLQPVSGQELLDLTLAITDNIAFYLPRNVNTQELVECAGPGGCVEVVQNFLDRELVAVTAYFGELVNSVE